MRMGTLLLVLFVVGCEPAPASQGGEGTHATPLVTAMPEAAVDAPIQPLPRELGLDQNKVALGEALFHDKRMSPDKMVACVDCHQLDKGGANGEYRTNLEGRDPVPVNVPSVFNLAFDFRFAWSGKFDTVGEQIDAAMALVPAMNGSWEAALKNLRTDTELAARFTREYPQGLSETAIRDALVVYCLSLVTPGSRFDRFLQGQERLTAQEERGYRMFRDYGCISCHQGVNVGGNMYQRFGVMEDYFATRGNLTKADLGLFAKTNKESDRHVFRVPSLRNVALTAPYFHDGSAPNLKLAVQTMARYQLGRTLTDDQAMDIVRFLATLTGEQPRPPS